MDSIWKNKKVNFLGDSLTYGKGTRKTYCDYLDEMIGFHTKRIYGISGSSISAGSGNSTGFHPFTDRYLNMSEDADLIGVFGGTNDFWFRHIPLGVMTDRDDSTFYGALHTLIVGLINKYPSSTIFFITPTHRAKGDGEGESTPNMHGHILADYVNAIKEVCAYYSIPICDLWLTSGIQPNIDAHRIMYTSNAEDTECGGDYDGLHLNEKGHSRIARIIYSFLETL